MVVNVAIMVITEKSAIVHHAKSKITFLRSSAPPAGSIILIEPKHFGSSYRAKLSFASLNQPRSEGFRINGGEGLSPPNNPSGKNDMHFNIFYP